MSKRISNQISILSACLAALLLAGCASHTPQSDTAGAKAAPTASAPAVPTDQWLGQWNGPEGTFLRLAGGNGNYQVTIQNLDGPRTFQGSGHGETIQFERNGVLESIRPTNGEQTGMKWLADKTNCLTVRVGEGYCKD